MPSKARTALLLFATLWVIGMVVWPGCATPPLPPLRQPIDYRKKRDFAFLKSSHVSRAEMIVKVGTPDEYFSDLRIACYRINQVTARKLWLLLGVIPVQVDKSPAGVEVALIQFDEHDRAQRFGI